MSDAEKFRMAVLKEVDEIIGPIIDDRDRLMMQNHRLRATLARRPSTYRDETKAGDAPLFDITRGGVQ